MAVAVLDRLQATIASVIRVRAPVKSVEIHSFIDPGVLKVEGSRRVLFSLQSSLFCDAAFTDFSHVPKNNPMPVNDQMVMKRMVSVVVSCCKPVNLVKDQAKLKRTQGELLFDSELR